jgi:hypothetical protein
MGKREYFTSVTATQDNIYGLNIDYVEGTPQKKDTVHLIKVTWDESGILPESFKLTPWVTKIEIDEENERIIGLSPLNSYVYVYNIKSDNVSNTYQSHK